MKKLFLLLLISIFCISNSWASEQTTNAFMPDTFDYTATFKENRFMPRVPQALVTFTFDDGYDTDSSIMAPVFIAQGEVATSAVVGELIGGGGRLSYSELLYLQNLGWEILNHTQTHAHLNAITLDSVRIEFSMCNDSLRAHGITVNNLEYPINCFPSITSI